MTIDITQFHATFFEESFEGLNTMESGLMSLDTHDFDVELINSIFRAVHSIKGGSATLGFSAIATFTHVLETLLDQVRSGSRNITQDHIDLLLRSIDCLRDIITAVKNSSTYDENVSSKLYSEITKAIEIEMNMGDVYLGKTSDSNRLHKKWNITFIPKDNLLVTGNDPVLILKELSYLGEVNINTHTGKLPDFRSINPETCYLSWEIALVSNKPESEIRDIFDWVLDDCELNITQGTDKDSLPLANNNRPISNRPLSMNIEMAPTSLPQNVALGDHKPTDNSSIRVNIDKIDDLINMVGELVITQSMIGRLDESIEDFDEDKLERLRNSLTLFERNTRELQESVMKIRMLPISYSFNRFPRMIRDLCKKLNKKATLRISGESTELDKTVMEKISDPLVHLIRNSIDHGIETPDVRSKSGKDEAGIISLNAYHKGGNIIIEISDDGAGINREKIKKKALEKGIISSIDIPNEQADDLIFHPGFSTADVVSDVSGRGVGLDVVKRNIRELGGCIDILSTTGHGTVFKIKLPLTLAIVDGQVLSVGDHRYIIPLVSIVESLQVKNEFINTINGSTEVYKVRDEYIPILRIHKVFNVKPKSTTLSEGLLVIIEDDGTRIGLFIDDLLDQMQVVIKNIESNYMPVEAISGATILGDGTVSLILDISGLINIYKKERISNNVAA